MKLHCCKIRLRPGEQEAGTDPALEQGSSRNKPVCLHQRAIHLPFGNSATGKLQWHLMYMFGQPRLGYMLLMATCCCGKLKCKDLFEMKEVSAHIHSGHFVTVKKECNIRGFACVGTCVAPHISQLEIILVPQAGACSMQPVERSPFA